MAKQIKFLKSEYTQNPEELGYMIVFEETEHTVSAKDAKGNTVCVNKDGLKKTWDWVKYIFIQDDDCHWYVIPEDQRAQFNAWVEETQDDWEQEGDGVLDFSEYAIGGAPALVKILDYVV